MSDYTILCDTLYEVGDRVHETAAGRRSSGCRPSGHFTLSVDIERHVPSDVFPPALKLLVATREVIWKLHLNTASRDCFTTSGAFRFVFSDRTPIAVPVVVFGPFRTSGLLPHCVLKLVVESSLKRGV
jgi:hypothetical protein